MGSLIPSEIWDWSKRWPLVVKMGLAAAALLVAVGVLLAVT